MELDYYQMLVEKKKMEDQIITSLRAMGDAKPCEDAKLSVQFPHHENILSSIRTSSFIVRAPRPPNKFHCTLSNNRVVLTWENHHPHKFTYGPTMYGVYASIGELSEICSSNNDVF